MALVFENDYSKNYSTTSFNVASSGSKVEAQIRTLNEAFGRYDIGVERKRIYQDEAVNMGISAVYMNMKYLALAFIIMDGFNEYEKPYDEMTLNIQEYLKEFFQSEKFNEYYENIASVKREESLANYRDNVKRVLFSYCFKLEAYRGRE